MINELLDGYYPDLIGYENNVLKYNGGHPDEPVELVLIAILDNEDFPGPDLWDYYDSDNSWHCIDCEDDCKGCEYES